MPRVFEIVPAYFVAAGLTALATNWLAARKWRKATAAHWTERARLLWPVRKGAATDTFLLPVCFGGVQFALDGGFSPKCVVAAIAALFGTLLGTWPLDREILPAMKFRQWLRMTALAWTQRIAWCVIWIGGSLIMPKEPDWQMGLIAAGVLAFHFALSRRLWWKIFALTGILIDASDRLRTIVADTSRRMNVPMPGVWLIDAPQGGAWAYPLLHKLLFSTGLMSICTDEEVASICAHELAHLTEPKRVLILRIVGSLVWFPLLFLRPAMYTYGDAGFFLVMLIFVLVAPIPGMVGRRMEKRADSIATEQQAEAGVYARALEKLYRQNQMPAVSESKRKIHPNLYDRMLAAGIQPDFERPRPPEGLLWIHCLLWFVFGPLIGWLLARSGF